MGNVTYKRSEQFTIPYPPKQSAFCKRFGLNAYWSGKHYQERRSDAKHMHDLTYYALVKSGVLLKPFENPVRIIFEYDDHMDIDNHGALEKMIVDAIKGRLIVNDDRRYYVERVSRFNIGSGRITVTVEEL